MGRACLIEDCPRPAGVPGSGRGYCVAHYLRLRRNGDPLTVRRRRNTCSIEGCDGPAYGRTWCQTHYARWRDRGSPTARLLGEIVDGRRICPECGEDRPLAEYSSTASYCRPCAAARQRARRASKPDPRRPQIAGICEVCGLIYFGDARRVKFCSPGCSAEGKRAWDRTNPPPPDRRAEHGRRHRERYPEKHWAKAAKYRARKRAAYVEPVDRMAVFQRDRYICQICRDPIDGSLSHPDPMSPSIDHRVALANGGAHSMENCQAAHLTCNLSKGARVEECAV